MDAEGVVKGYLDAVATGGQLQRTFGQTQFRQPVFFKIGQQALHGRLASHAINRRGQMTEIIGVADVALNVVPDHQQAIRAHHLRQRCAKYWQLHRQRVVIHIGAGFIVFRRDIRLEGRDPVADRINGVIQQVPVRNDHVQVAKVDGSFLAGLIKRHGQGRTTNGLGAVYSAAKGVALDRDLTGRVHDRGIDHGGRLTFDRIT